MNTKKIANAATYKVSEFGEQFTQPSKTVPDMSIPIRTLLERYVKGQPIPTGDPVYLDEDTVVPDNVERMDPFERLDAARNLQRGIKSRVEELNTVQLDVNVTDNSTSTEQPRDEGAGAGS